MLTRIADLHDALGTGCLLQTIGVAGLAIGIVITASETPAGCAGGVAGIAGGIAKAGRSGRPSSPTADRAVAQMVSESLTASQARQRMQPTEIACGDRNLSDRAAKARANAPALPASEVCRGSRGMKVDVEKHTR